VTTGLGLDVASLATKVLAAVEGQFADASVTLPERRFVAPGAPEGIAWDSEQLVVTMQGIGQGAAPSQGGRAMQVGGPMSAMGLRHVVLVAELVRCNPEATNSGRTPPTPATMTKAGLGLLRDAGLLTQALTDLCATLPSTLPQGSQCEAGAVTPVGPDGGLVAVRGSIAVTAATLV
jgi:hypothetical protein